jgi:hypothetical protein
MSGACAANEVSAAIKDVERQSVRFSWPLIAERNESFAPPFDIEPGEKQTLDFEFVTPWQVKVVRIYAYFRNDKKAEDDSEVGWAASGYYDFRAPVVRPGTASPSRSGSYQAPTNGGN